MGFGVNFAIFELLITEINDKCELISFLSPHWNKIKITGAFPSIFTDKFMADIVSFEDLELCKADMLFFDSNDPSNLPEHISSELIDTDIVDVVVVVARATGDSLLAEAWVEIVEVFFALVLVPASEDAIC